MDDQALAFGFCLTHIGVEVNYAELDLHIRRCQDQDPFKKYHYTASKLGLKLKKVSIKNVSKLDAPIIINLSDHGHCVLVRVAEGAAFIFKASNPHVPLIISVADLKDYRVLNGLKIIKKFTDERHPFRLARKYLTARTLMTIAVSSIAIQLLSLALPLFTQIVIDKVVVHHNKSALGVFSAIILLAIAAEFILSVTRIFIISTAGEQIDLSISSRVYSSILKKPLAFFSTARTGELVSIARKADFVKNFLATGGIFNFIDLMFVFVFVSAMFFYSSKIAYICIGLTGLIILINFASTKFKPPAAKSSQAETILIEAISGVETIKLTSREGYFNKKINKSLIDGSVDARLNIVYVNSLFSMNTCLQRLSSLTVLGVGASLVINGELTMGQVIALQMLSSRVFHPAARAVSTIEDFNSTKQDLVEIGARVSEPRVASLLNINTVHSIRARDLYFRYSNDQALLVGINFQIKRGEKIGIIGRSGTGKSTLLKLLVSLYAPTAGSISINNIDARQINTSILRSKVQLIPQSAFLHSGTMLENICNETSLIDPDELDRLIALLDMEEMISAHPSGLHREISENGNCLSGGQRQKICLLRSLISKPDVLLLDEATSGIDERSEAILHDRLVLELPDVTIITVTHRNSMLTSYDRVYELSHGKLEIVRERCESHHGVVTSET